MKFATLDDVKMRLEDEVTPQMEKMIEAGLEEATDLAIHYGTHWTAENVPGPVTRIVASAVARWIRNPMGLNQSRAADETLEWNERGALGKVSFDDEEIERVQKLAQVPLPGFGSAPSAPDYYNPRAERDLIAAQYVPVAHGGDPFPFLVQEFRNRPVFE